MTDEIRACSSVNRIYPRLKEIELICASADIQVPLTLIEEKKTELSHDFMISAFGEPFLKEHGLYKSLNGQNTNGKNGHGTPSVRANENIRKLFNFGIPDAIKSTPSKLEVLLITFTHLCRYNFVF